MGERGCRRRVRVVVGRHVDRRGLVIDPFLVDVMRSWRPAISVAGSAGSRPPRHPARSADTSEPAWVKRKMLSMKRRTSRPSTSRKYSAIVSAEAHASRAPGGLVHLANTKAVLASTPDSVISLIRSFALARPLTHPGKTETPACSWATFRISSWMMTVLPTPAPPKIPILPPFLNGQTSR